MPATDILGFYQRGRRVSRLNKTYHEWVFEATDDEWESCHDFIQYLFPNTHSSGNAPAAYMSQPDFVNTFQNNDELKGQMQQAFERYTAFLGFSGQHIYNDKRKIHGTQHNTLRISRVLRALRLAGLNTLSFKFLIRLLRLIQRDQVQVTTFTEEEWKDACLWDGQWRYSSIDECIAECRNLIKLERA